MESHIDSSLLRRLRRKLYSVLQVLVTPFEKFVALFLKSFKIDLETIVIGSGVATSYRKYVEKVSMALLPALLFSSIASTLLALHLSAPPLVIALLALVAPLLIVLPIAMALAISIPVILYRNRGEVLESKALQLLLALSLLGASGQSIYKNLEALPIVLGKDFKFFFIEIDLATSLIRAGVPVDEALKRVSNITPSQTLRELFSSLASAIAIGGGITNVLSSLLERYVSRYSIRIEKSVETLNVYMEVYVAVALLIPVLVGSIAALLLLYPISWLSFDALMILTTLLLVPIASTSIVVLSDVIVSRMRP
ncbi:MAG: type II secretion system F family protein [Ignisphaera sp.]